MLTGGVGCKAMAAEKQFCGFDNGCIADTNARKTLVNRLRGGSPSDSGESSAGDSLDRPSATSTTTFITMNRWEAEGSDVIGLMEVGQDRCLPRECHRSEAWVRDQYFRNELVNVKRTFRSRMLTMKVKMKDEEAALKEKIAKLESEAIDLLAATSRLTEVEEENRHLRLTVTNLVTILAECNKQEPKRLKLG